MDTDTRRELDRVWSRMASYDTNLVTVAGLSSKVDSIIEHLERMGRDRKWALTQSIAITLAIITNIVVYVVR